eukprot:TRINITY_DN5062_c0_g1_i1.p1 TRINITY_DN5062_c0_g1~~TRINITY_DN5062_c0_g1_i1.p1  ORF type:complete len:346 (+),score=30.06 TRINITY_DN5062_c0_g1_i1:147-1040(+)
MEESLDEAVSTLLALTAADDSLPFREASIENMEGSINHYLSEELSTELARKKGVGYFVDLFKTYESWEQFPLNYFLTLLRFQKWADDMAQTNLLSYLVRNMDKAVPVQRHYLKLIFKLANDERNVQRLLEDVDINELMSIVDDYRGIDELEPLASAVLFTLYISPKFRHSVSTLQNPETDFYYSENLLQANINTADHFLVCSTLNRVLKFAKNDPELLQMIQTQEVPRYKLSSHTIVPTYIMCRWGAHFLAQTRRIPSVPFFYASFLSLMAYFGQTYAQAFFKQGHDYILEPENTLR